jgi:predicted anti-sigma-YlaC factor YlaD
MGCEYYKEQFTLLLTDSLDRTRREALENHLTVCMDCRKEFNEAKKVWDLMGEVPEPIPSDTMRSRFSALLNNFKKQRQANNNFLHDWIIKLREYLLLQVVQPRLVFTILIAGIGFVAGLLLNRNGQTAVAYTRQIDSLSAQVSEMQQMIMFTLLQDPSASQRIRAVGYTVKIGQANSRIIDALLTTLNEDPNVNVRLAALESLVRYAEEPRVREGLIQSLTSQESPLLQSAIADVMVKLQEKKSIQNLQKLLLREDLNKMVKTKIEQSIDRLI